MRVIGGSARGTPLQVVPGSGTRPVSDRVKEALFDILAADIEGARVLDLFAGTGSVGIEALSRGAAEVVFVESQPRAIATIRANLERTRLSDRASVVKADVFRFLAGPPQPFDLIYIAPPQYQGLWIRALETIDAGSGWLSPEGRAVAQIHPKEYREVPLPRLHLVDERRYGSTLLCFYEPCSALP